VRGELVSYKQAITRLPDWLLAGLTLRFLYVFTLGWGPPDRSRLRSGGSKTEERRHILTPVFFTFLGIHQACQLHDFGSVIRPVRPN
jgi:hypothetical protein